jgi:glyceraldehyde 3-phosphate dehydrogenase
VVPALEGKIGGLGIQVQTAAVSLLDITLKLEQEADYEAVCAAVVKASEGSLSGVLGFTEAPLVSGDFVGEQRSAVVDFSAGLQLAPGMVKLVVW